MVKKLKIDGKKLLQLRTDKNWSRRELGEKLGGLNEAAIGNGHIGINNSGNIITHANHKLEQIEKAILEMENIDPKIAMQILKIIKTYKD